MYYPPSVLQAPMQIGGAGILLGIGAVMIPASIFIEFSRAENRAKRPVLLKEVGKENQRKDAFDRWPLSKLMFGTITFRRTI